MALELPSPGSLRSIPCVRGGWNGDLHDSHTTQLWGRESKMLVRALLPELGLEVEREGFTPPLPQGAQAGVGEVGGTCLTPAGQEGAHTSTVHNSGSIKL